VQHPGVFSSSPDVSGVVKEKLSWSRYKER